MIRILLVDDSPSVRIFLRGVIEQDSALQIIGEGHDGKEAVSLADELLPDLVLMDMVMPRLDGAEATRAILHRHAVPIVLYSSTWDSGKTVQALKAMESGAVAALPLPPGRRNPKHDQQVRDFVKTIKTMAGVNVVRRIDSDSGQKRSEPATTDKLSDISGLHTILAIGASTGGPLALRELLSGLPSNMGASVLVVQHIAPGFLQGMMAWLQDNIPFNCRVAVQGDRLVPGVVYFAPEGRHMKVRGNSIRLSDEPPVDGLRPTVGHLFASLADGDAGRTVAVLMTGMGSDGARELKQLRDKGAATFVQNKESCLVYGMPREAVRLGAAEHVLSPEGISRELTKLLSMKGVVE